MLSIGKVGMARGQQLYYEQQVAQGREDCGVSEFVIERPTFSTTR
jgi:hypothetical protein